MELIPIYPEETKNMLFLNDPACKPLLVGYYDFYKKIGFTFPWISYFARQNDKWVGTCSYKGISADKTVEIAYYTFPEYQGQGIGTAMCRELVHIAAEEGPEIRITARTLPQENASTSILKKNGFHLLGLVHDPEDGEVWEWLWAEKLEGE
jgi:RimJ/RimL family protein N-acetyltransferase